MSGLVDRRNAIFFADFRWEPLLPVWLREKEPEPFEIRPCVSGGMTVRAATREDIDAIFALETAAFARDELSRRAISRFVAAPHKPMMVARRADRLAGYALVSLRKGGRTCRIYSLAVDPAYGRRGVGRELVHACERWALAHGCEAVRLEARWDNAPAIALYRGLGYDEFDCRSQYYSDGAQALRLEKKLKPPRGIAADSAP